MPFALTDKSKKFIKQVKTLLDSGKVRSITKLAEEIEWNNTAISQVLSGSRNVPNDVFARFTNTYTVEVEDTTRLNMEALIKIEAMNSVILGALAEVLAHQRGQSVTKVSSDLVSAVNSQSKDLLAKLK